MARLTADVQVLERMIACEAAFKDANGRTIPTEQITEGLFWRMHEALADATKEIEHLSDWLVSAPDHDVPTAAAAQMHIRTYRALLSSLKIEEGQ